MGKSCSHGGFRGITDAQIYCGEGQESAENKAMCDEAQGYIENYIRHAK
jgi:hypothetical protein